MRRELIEITSDIVKTQLSLAPMTAADITLSLRQIFITLHELQRTESGQIELPKIRESAPAPLLTPADSIQENKIICLECGVEMKQLTKMHLDSHGMSTKEYKKKYGFAMKTPLAARALTKARRKTAKKRGLPDNLKKYIEARKQAKAGAKTSVESIVPQSERAKRVRKRFSPKNI
jgi:predicted transcriptional regulator